MRAGTGPQQQLRKPSDRFGGYISIREKPNRHTHSSQTSLNRVGVDKNGNKNARKQRNIPKEREKHHNKYVTPTAGWKL